MNELYNYVNSSPEKAIIVANLFKQTVNAECPKVCVIYGLILANHLETLTEFTHEELIVCKALENATDYDLKNFKEIMENYLKPTSNGRRIVFPKDFEILLLSPPHAIGVYIIESLFLAQQSGVKWKKAFWI